MKWKCAKCGTVFSGRARGEVCGRMGCNGNLILPAVEAAKCPHCGSAYFPELKPNVHVCPVCHKPYR